MGTHRSGAVEPTRDNGRHRLEMPRKMSTAAAVVVAGAAVLGLGTPAVASAQELPPDSIAQCESGGDNQAQNSSSTASGKWQFINGTWAAYGGREFAPTAAEATEREQDIVASRAFAAEGTTPWNASKSCWGGKSSASSSIAAGAAVKAEVNTQAPKPKVVQTETVKPKADTSASLKLESFSAPKAKDPVVIIENRVPDGSRFTAGGTGDYTVQNGDTLSKLALEYDVTVDGLMARNNTIIENRDWIFVGEKLNTNV